MTVSGGRTTILCVGDIVNLTDDHTYRVLKSFAPAGTIVLKSTDGSTHRSSLRTPDHVVISAPPMVTRPTQTDPPPSASDDPLAHAILQGYGPNAVAAYQQTVPFNSMNVIKMHQFD